ncbi:hypothetical protein W02_31660 [Nitrospira sp. KM1]|nr:hypothetical protein W02_31660 [Nitrospira sp. KM1]
MAETREHDDGRFRISNEWDDANEEFETRSIRKIQLEHNTVDVSFCEDVFGFPDCLGRIDAIVSPQISQPKREVLEILPVGINKQDMPK